MSENEVERCEAAGCQRLADWAYIGESGDLYLCDFHAGAGESPGWVRIERPRR